MDFQVAGKMTLARKRGRLRIIDFTQVVIVNFTCVTWQ